MRPFFTSILACLFFSTVSCREKTIADSSDSIEKPVQELVIDTIQISAFFDQHSDLQIYSNDVRHLYSKNKRYIWHDTKGPSEFASVLLNELNQIADEGISVKVPYESKLRTIMSQAGHNASADTELLLSSLYFFYLKNVYHGLDADKSKGTNWFLPRNERSYKDWTDSLANDRIITRRPALFDQYYKLRTGLKKYRAIEDRGGWQMISMHDTERSLRPGDSSKVIPMIRHRLYMEGYMAVASDNPIYDDDLVDAVKTYQQRHNRTTDGLITGSLIKDWNVSVADRIRTIAVNMERCRWISSSITSNEFIAVNIPSFRLHYFRDGKLQLTSKVVVGKEMHKTVVFSGDLSYIVFSPYWNVPTSILESEIKPAMERNPHYLEERNFEWYDGRVRQKPGPTNSLGLVKFMFPNSNNIYLHDTPSKSLFNKDERAFSHGCIRVEKARELAISIAGNDARWSVDKVDEMMRKGTETTLRLKKKIPVYIAYFTAWSDEHGNVAFYKDLYDRDNRLDKLLQQ